MNASPTLIHLCLISERPLANLIPLLQYQPDYVALGISTTMRRKGEEFRRLLASLGYSTDRVINFEVPEQGIEPIREAALHIETELKTRFPGCRIGYNATGGTKLMALGFAELLGSGNNQVFYTDTAQERIEFIYPTGRASETMHSVLSIEVYLRAHGKRLRRAASDDLDWQKRAQARKPLTKWLAHQAGALEPFFGVLNALAQNALEQNPPRGQTPRIVKARQEFNTKPWGLWLEALEKMSKHQCCQWEAADPVVIQFHDAEAAEYLAGHWLEEYVWHVIADAAPEEVKVGAEFTDMAHHREDVRNELDCIAAHRNRLLLVECKTGKLDQAAGVVYKLDSIANDMGLFQQRLLVSARSLDETTRARAKEQSIAVVDASGLKQLRETVMNWIGNYPISLKADVR